MPLHNKAFRFKVQIFGKVQGVWFRKFTKEQAESLDLIGWVKNESDLSVSTVFQGSYASCIQMLEWLERGSPNSSVEDIRIEQLDALDSESTFEILY